MSNLTVAELAGFLRDAGHRHHEAFTGTDGADPEWALWYAGYLQATLWDRLGRLPTRSELVYLLVGAERAHAAAADGVDWPEAYARHLLVEGGFH